MASHPPDDHDGESDGGVYLAIFATLTAKQHEVFALVAEGRSSKEIAWRLNVTDSAVNQRIEAVRSRAGSPPRAELARAYRQYAARQASLSRQREATLPLVLAPDLPAMNEPVHALSRDRLQAGDLARSAQMPGGFIVPRAFIGPDAALNRIAAMVVIAVGLLMVAMIGLSVIQALAAML